jgi:hypothetical protein
VGFGAPYTGTDPKTANTDSGRVLYLRRWRLMSAKDAHTWSEWHPFPNPDQAGILCAPFGPGCYELRQRNGSLIYVGSGGHVAQRMTSLLPAPHGAGTRNNKDLRDFIFKNLATVEYRTTVCSNRAQAHKLELDCRALGKYLFPT